jgi:glutamate-1-semialdehyde 2,1-aminomutase
MPSAVAMNTHFPSIDESDALWRRAQGLIPGGTQTLAKGPGQWVRGIAPKYVQRGRGGHVFDVDGNEYIDLNLGVGPLILGYGNRAVDEAIRVQLEDGITFTLMHPLEVEVAELINDVVPGAESVRFSKTGCDVTSAAVRLARAFTGRDGVLCCGYHGWHDWYISVTDRNLGIPSAVTELTYTFAYNDMQSVAAAIDDDTACVILEPAVFEAPGAGFLEELKTLCHARGALLIFDEMWTGFRLALGGAQERFGVTADLACFSKAVANGMPLSVLTGRRDVMRLLDKDVFFFTTFGGEALSLAAAKATIGELRRHDVPGYIDALGNRLRDGYNALAGELGLSGFTRAAGFGARSMIIFEGRDLALGEDPLLLKSVVQQEMIRRGVLWAGFNTVCFAHTEADVDHVLAAYRQSLLILAGAIASGTVSSALLGHPVEPVFRRTSNFNLKPREKAHG